MAKNDTLVNFYTKNKIILIDWQSKIYIGHIFKTDVSYITC